MKTRSVLRPRIASPHASSVDGLELTSWFGSDGAADAFGSEELAASYTANGSVNVLDTCSGAGVTGVARAQAQLTHSAR